MKQTQPDIARILSAKAQRRRALVALSWEEKVAIIERMRALLPQGQWKDRSAEEELSSNGHADQQEPPADAPAGMMRHVR